MRSWIHYTNGGMASFGAFHYINDASDGGEGDQILVVWNSILVDLMLLVGLFWKTTMISTWNSIEFLNRPESFRFSSFSVLLFQKKSKQVRLKCHKTLQDKLIQIARKEKNITKLIACQRRICSSHCQRDVPNNRFVRDNRIQPINEGTEIWNALWSIPPTCWRQPEIASRKKTWKKTMTSKSEAHRGYVSLVWNMQILESSQNCWFLPTLICLDWVIWLRNCALQRSIFRYEIAQRSPSRFSWATLV